MTRPDSTARPAEPPRRADPHVTPAQRAAITARLGVLPDPLLRAVRDARGSTFQRIEFLGDAVLELVVRLHADAAGAACTVCRGDADPVTTDAALADAADTAGLGEWLEWEASRERRADLVEACAGAVWLTHGWTALANLVDSVVHPLAPLTPAAVANGGAHAPTTGSSGPRREVLGASVIEVAAAHHAFLTSSGGPGELTELRNRWYGTRRVVDLAARAGWLSRPPAEHDSGRAAQRDEVERRLAELALTDGLAVAVEAATDLLREP